MRRKAAAVGIGLLTLLTGSLVVSQRDTTRAPPPSPSPTVRIAIPIGPRIRTMVQLTNRARVARQIPKLTLSAYASGLAKQHSRKMARRNELFHSRYYVWAWWGENVGVGPSVRSLFKAFMNSPPHKANMLNKIYNHIGVGFVRSADRLWVTMVFYKK